MGGLGQFLMATAHARVEGIAVGTLVIVFDPLDGLEEVLDEAQLGLAPRHRLGLYNRIAGVCGGCREAAECLTPFTLEAMRACVVLFLHVVALANVVGVGKTPAAICVDPRFRMIRHVAVNTLPTPRAGFPALVAEWHFVVLPPKDPIRLSAQLTHVCILRSIRNTLLVALAAGALAVMSRLHFRRGVSYKNSGWVAWFNFYTSVFVIANVKSTRPALM